MIRSAYTESEDRRCGGRLRQNGHGVDTARRALGLAKSEEGLTMSLLVSGKYGDHALGRYTEPRSMHWYVSCHAEQRLLRCLNKTQTSVGNIVSRFVTVEDYETTSQ